MSCRNTKQLGVTQPISMSPPTPQDLQLTESLNEALKSSGFFESEADSEKREIVLGKLNLIVQGFVRSVAKDKGLPESLANEVVGKIFTFGSYRLGVHSRGADIDTLCVAPQHVDRGDFFTKFYEMLQNVPEVTELTQVPDAYVPVVNMEFSGICIDLVFARLPFASIPEDLDLLDHNLLKNLDEKSMLSLNGSRATDEILRLVPDVLTFHGALRCIKLWAKRRGLYNNAMGYLGGVACALLTARICQLYPNASASAIVTRFFKIYQQWAWPQPVYLKPIEDFPLNQKVWNPKLYPADRNHRMPVITPAYPSMCSTHNVTKSTLALMTSEFARGSEMMLKIEQGSASWADLFARSDFFARYRHFFQILAVSESAEVHRIWSGFVESKVRILMNKLELEANIAVAPPFTETYEVVLKVDPLDPEDLEKPRNFSMDQVCSAHFHNPSKEASDESKNTSNTTDTTDNAPITKTIHSTAFYIGLGIAPFDPTFKGPRRLVLDRPVAEFKYFVMNWEKHCPSMQLEVRDIKRENLPEYIFNEEMKRPLPRQPAVRKVKRDLSSESTTTTASSEVDHKSSRVKIEEN
jgi:poly(A) polymerase